MFDIWQGVLNMQNRVKDLGDSEIVQCSKDLSFQHKTLEERATEYGGKLNLDGEYDWGAPVGRERWCE